MKRLIIVPLSLSVGMFFLFSACASSNANVTTEASQSATAISSAREEASSIDKSTSTFINSTETASEPLPASSVSSKDISASEKMQPNIQLDLPITMIILDGDGLPVINADLRIPQILDGNFFHKSKSDGSYLISENDVGELYTGNYNVMVNVIAGNGKRIQENVSFEFDKWEDNEPYILKLSTRLTSPPEEVRPTHDNIVLRNSAGNPLPDLWITLKRNRGELSPAAGYVDETYGYTDQNGTFVWWSALSVDYICTVYSAATYDLDAKLGSFPFNIKDRDHSYEYTFELDLA